MSRFVSHRPAVVAIFATLTLSACAKPPLDAIAAAEHAQQLAVAAGAETYAPEALTAVTMARAELDAELAAQQEKMSLTRSFGRAEELAAAYALAAQQATETAAQAKDQARTDATDLITQGHSALAEATSLLSSAPRGKGSAADLAALQSDLQMAATALADAETALSTDQFLEARSSASSAVEAITRVKNAVVTAQAAIR